MTTVHDYLILLPKVKDAKEHLKKLEGLVEKIYVTVPVNSVIKQKTRTQLEALDRLDGYLDMMEKDIAKYRR